jgi:hypothetical protein
MTFREALKKFHDGARLCQSPLDRLNLCREFADISLSDRRVKSALERREQWRRRTGKMHANDWEGHECFICGGRATQRHHVIPIGRGGLPTKKNTTWIDRECHALIHPWMRTHAAR